MIAVKCAWAGSSAHTQAALLPLFVQHVSDPLAMFLQVLPNGFDKATDGLKSSLRVEMAGTTNAQCEPASHGLNSVA